MKDAGRYWEIPPDSFPNLEQAGVIPSGATNRDGAMQLRDFLRGIAGREILRRYGFTLPGEAK
jgi:ABC-type molybdate transport system substrate-binding protein